MEHYRHKPAVFEQLLNDIEDFTAESFLTQYIRSIQAETDYIGQNLNDPANQVNLNWSIFDREAMEEAKEE